MKTKLKQALDKSKPWRMQVGDWFLGSTIGSFITGALCVALGILAVVVITTLLVAAGKFIWLVIGFLGLAGLAGNRIREDYRKSNMWRHRNSQWYKNTYGQR